MRFRISTYLVLVVTLLTTAFGASAQLPTDTIYAPNVLFSGLPRTYEIADIEVRGADNYDENNVIGYTGLKIGDIIEVPGSDLTQKCRLPSTRLSVTKLGS